MNPKHIKNLKNISKYIKKSVSLEKYNSFKIKSTADILIAPSSVYELIDIIKYAKENDIKYQILGGGTNVLISDFGVNGIIIYMGKLNRIKRAGKSYVSAFAGATVDNVCKFAMKYDLSGFEFAYGLPGTIGGATFMNARCYGFEMADIIESVSFLDENLEYIKLSKNELNFEYKKSIFQNGKLIICEVEFNLIPSYKEKVKVQMKANYLDRKNKNQYKQASAGCIFLNNKAYGMPTGRIIDSLGLRGIREGGAMVSTHHANFIVNSDEATSRDIYLLIKRIQTTVKEHKGIMLVPEIHLFGEWGSFKA